MRNDPQHPNALHFVNAQVEESFDMTINNWLTTKACWAQRCQWKQKFDFFSFVLEIEENSKLFSCSSHLWTITFERTKECSSTAVVWAPLIVICPNNKYIEHALCLCLYVIGICVAPNTRDKWFQSEFRLQLLFAMYNNRSNCIRRTAHTLHTLFTHITGLITFCHTSSALNLHSTFDFDSFCFVCLSFCLAANGAVKMFALMCGMFAEVFPMKNSCTNSNAERSKDKTEIKRCFWMDKWNHEWLSLWEHLWFYQDYEENIYTYTPLEFAETVRFHVKWVSWRRP